MWRVISFLLLFLGLAGFSFADTVQPITKTVYQAYRGGTVYGTGSTPDEACATITGLYDQAGPPFNNVPDGGCAYRRNSDAGKWVAGDWRVISQVTCPTGYDLSSDQSICTKSDPVDPSACTAAQLNTFCATNQSRVVDTSSFGVGDRTRICDNVHPSIPGCNIPPNWGCRITRSYSSSSFSYNGQSCSQSADSPNSSSQNGLGQKDCATGEYYGEVNGVPGCYGGGPVPPSSSPPVTDGKDANGNCAAGYVGRIGSSGALECIPSTQPDSSANCPTGWNKIGVGGQTVCVDPNSKPGDPIPTNPGSGGGGGGKTDTSSPSKDPGKGDSSSPGIDDPSKCTLPDWVCNLGNGVSGPDGGSPSGLGSMGGDISALLDTSDFFGGGSCPAPKVVSVPLYFTTWEWTISYDPFCNIVSRLRPAVIACGFLVAVAIVVKR